MGIVLLLARNECVYLFLQIVFFEIAVICHEIGSSIMVINCLQFCVFISK